MNAILIQKIADAFLKAFRGLLRSIPVILIVVLMISLLKVYIRPEAIAGLFGFSPFTDTFLGAAFGSVLAGNSINSYIIGSGFLSSGVPFAAVSAFLASWVIVGVAQLPAESAQLGTRFAVLRAVIGFFFSVFIGMLTAMVFGGGLV